MQSALNIIFLVALLFLKTLKSCVLPLSIVTANILPVDVVIICVFKVCFFFLPE